MMNYLLIFLTILATGCASRYQIERHHNSFLRRMPQINKIETGRALQQGGFTASGNIHYSFKQPAVMKISDSSFESRSSIAGDEFTIITSSNAYCYESRLMISGEGSYAFTDIIAAGISLDASIGQIKNIPANQRQTIKDDDIEGALFIKFAKKFNDITVSIRPEAAVVHLYGDRIWAETDNEADQLTATERLSFYTVSVRSSSVIRYDIMDLLSPFLGVQIKSQPFPTAGDEINHEVAYGIFGGIDIERKYFAISPFIALPIGSSTSHFRSPVSGGIQVSLLLRPQK